MNSARSEHPGAGGGADGYAALLFDLDGTLLDDEGLVDPRNRAALERVRAQGAKVLLCTGRSVISTRPVLEALGLDTPAITFNGSVVWDPLRERALEEQLLAPRTLARALAFAAEHDLLSVVMRVDAKFSTPPRSDLEDAALRWLRDLRMVEREGLAVENAVRVTLFGRAWPDSGEFCDQLERHLARPAYLTHFPLTHLPHHRGSALQVVDVQAPSRGKAEGLRVVEELWGIPPSRVIAFGDAMNDVPMLRAAGLGVAMGNGMGCAIAAADVVLEGNGGDEIARFLDQVIP